MCGFYVHFVFPSSRMHDFERINKTFKIHIACTNWIHFRWFLLVHFINPLRCIEDTNTHAYQFSLLQMTRFSYEFTMIKWTFQCHDNGERERESNHEIRDIKSQHIPKQISLYPIEIIPTDCKSVHFIKQWTLFAILMPFYVDQLCMLLLLLRLVLFLLSS